MVSLEDLISSANAHFSSGSNLEAEHLLKLAIQLNQKSPSALHLMGVLQATNQKHAEALVFLNKAVTYDPLNGEVHYNLAKLHSDMGNDALAIRHHKLATSLTPTNKKYWLNYGNSLNKLARYDDALVPYDRALNLDEKYFEAWMGAGLALGNLKRLNQSLDCFIKASEINPNNEGVWLYLGHSLSDLKSYREAINSYRRAIEIKTNYPEAWSGLGLAAYKMDNMPEAINACQMAINLRPDYAEALTDMSVYLHHLGRYDEALNFCNQAIATDPNYAQAWVAKGACLGSTEQHEDALNLYEQALKIRPNYDDALIAKGAVLTLLGNTSAAECSYNDALKINPLSPDGRWNLALLNLTLGNFNAGWEGYEYRWSYTKAPPPRHQHIPKFSLKGPKHSKVLIWCEQGLGDTIQFFRYFHPFKQLGYDAILEVQPQLFNLFSEIDPTIRIASPNERIEGYDCQLPLASLPRLFQATPENIPNEPYIATNLSKAAYWKNKLKSRRKMKVGIVWSGGFRPDQPSCWAINTRRNIPLSIFSQLNQCDVDFYSLQKGEPAESELNAYIGCSWNQSSLFNFTEELRDFSDTAALIQNLDLIISVDTSTAHLAAAMGKPVWLLNRFDTCWRWLLERSDSAWYPSMKIYRQPAINDWNSVIAKVSRDLNEISLLHNSTH